MDESHLYILFEFDKYFLEDLDKNEYLAFDVSTNGGITWSERGRLRGNVDTENTWHTADIMVNNATNIQLRFRAKMSDSTEDANVDTVKVVGF